MGRFSQAKPGSPLPSLSVSDFWPSRRILLTGGAGFVGTALRKKLDQRGAVDVAIPRSRDYDLTKSDDVARLFEDSDPDLVIHLAARVGGIGANMEHPADLYVANLLMGTFLLEEARKREVAKTVLLGTICSYPKFTEVPFKEDDLWSGFPEETNAPYGVAKKAMLVHAQANRQQYGQNSIYLLPTNMYGPGDKFNPSVSHVIPALIKKAVEAKEAGDDSIEVWGTGSATREFLYVDDTAEGVLLATEHYDGAEPVNLGTDEEVAIKDLAELIIKLVGFEGELVWDRSKPDGQPRRRVDNSRAKELFGFTPQVSLEEGLRRTIDWYLANREVAEQATF
jgi:GDP-L-fucose synthase